MTDLTIGGPLTCDGQKWTKPQSYPETPLSPPLSPVRSMASPRIGQSILESSGNETPSIWIDSDEQWSVAKPQSVPSFGGVLSPPPSPEPVLRQPLQESTRQPTAAAPRTGKNTPVQKTAGRTTARAAGTHAKTSSPKPAVPKQPSQLRSGTSRTPRTPRSTRPAPTPASAPKPPRRAATTTQAPTRTRPARTSTAPVRPETPTTTTTAKAGSTQSTPRRKPAVPVQKRPATPAATSRPTTPSPAPRLAAAAASSVSTPTTSRTPTRASTPQPTRTPKPSLLRTSGLPANPKGRTPSTKSTLGVVGTRKPRSQSFRDSPRPGRSTVAPSRTPSSSVPARPRAAATASNKPPPSSLARPATAPKPAKQSVKLVVPEVETTTTAVVVAAPPPPAPVLALTATGLGLRSSTPTLFGAPAFSLLCKL